MSNACPTNLGCSPSEVVASIRGFSMMPDVSRHSRPMEAEVSDASGSHEHFVAERKAAHDGMHLH